MSLVVVDLGLGNIASVVNMLKRVGAASVVAADSETISTATKLVLPGVGAFDTGMRRVEELGLRAVLDARVLRDEVPVLGICLGMQLLTSSSEEGTLPGLGWLDAVTVRLAPAPDTKVPHMGWNTVAPCSPQGLFEGLDDGARFYFVHSYHVVCRDDRDVLARTEYGIAFASAVRRANVHGVQFHPEKSHRFGMKLLRNFVAL